MCIFLSDLYSNLSPPQVDNLNLIKEQEFANSDKSCYIMCFAHIFSYSVACLLLFLIVSFEVLRFVILMMSDLDNFFFYRPDFW